VIGEEFVIGEAGEEVDTLGGYLVAPSRASAGARRNHFRPRRLRDRSARRRPAPRQAAAYRHPQGPLGLAAPGNATARSRRGPPRATPTAAARPHPRTELRPREHLGTRLYRQELVPSVSGSFSFWGWKRAIIAARRRCRCRRWRWRRSCMAVLFVTFPIMVWLIDGRRRRTARRPAGGGAERMVVRASAIFRPGFTGSVTLSWWTRISSDTCCHSR